MEGSAPPSVLGIVVLLVAVLLAGAAASASRSTPTTSRAAPAPFTARADLFDNKTFLFRKGQVVPMGPAGSFDDYEAGNPSVLYDAGIYKMWYSGCNAGLTCQIGYATSLDGRTWTKQGVVLSPSLPAETTEVLSPNVMKFGGQYWMWYNGYDGSIFRIFAANSTNGITWTKHGAVLGPGPAGANDSYEVLYPSALLVGSTIRLYYTGLTSLTYPYNAQGMLATSTDGLIWTRVGTVLPFGAPGALDCCNIIGVSVALSGSESEMVYWAGGPDGVNRFFFAQSADGIAWQRLGLAIAPNTSEPGIGAPDLVFLPNGTFDVYYHVRLGSTDLSIYLAWGAEDLWPPVLSVSATGATGNHGWYTSPAEVWIVAHDNLSGVGSVQYRLNGGPWQFYVVPFNLTDGITLVEAAATDNVGNIATASPLVVSVDTRPPSVVVEAPGGIVTSSRVTVRWNGSDTGSGIDHYALSVDGQPYVAEGTNTSTTLTLSDGSHQIRVEAVDRAGNLAFDSGTVTVDTNVFSFTGPYGPYLFYGAVVAIVAIPFIAFVAMVYWMFGKPRRRT